MSYRGIYSPERFLGHDFRESRHDAACRAILLLKSIFLWGGGIFCDEFYFFDEGGGNKKVDFRAVFWCFSFNNQ